MTNPNEEWVLSKKRRRWIDGADPDAEPKPKVRASYDGPRVQVHVFTDETEAYDGSQCEDFIKDGDVLVAERERTVAVLVKAWPTLVAGTLEQDTGTEFHRLAPGANWKDLEGGRYVFNAAVAWSEAQRRGWA